ncbi:LLM class flavin-dependent oxidoreductase [Dactylosporangium sp. NPDC051541]|uniref:LLM class flavin-dependent oxidoreductase n=1 Tax=Dactylosporangium sp. NPDC051541 TaxID=3363977 RepID=UPI0037B1D32E
MVEVYTTAPASAQLDGAGFRRRLADVTRWTEAAGHTGLLVYSDNTLIDPWLVAQLILAGSERVAPLVAVQPVYVSPYAAARAAATLTFLHGRAVHLNLVTGGSRPQLEALGDGETGHDERYARIREYTRIVRQLLESPRPVTFAGRFFQVQAASLPHRPPGPLRPRLVLSGSSDAAVSCADELGILRFAYPLPVSEYPGGRSGIRLGVIARDSAQDAWRAAQARFPGDPMGERRHRVVRGLSDSHWYAALSAVESAGCYWLHPFRTYRTFCPYLVGSYAEVGAYLAGYFARGVESVILDIPAGEDDLHHARIAFDRAPVAESTADL